MILKTKTNLNEHYGPYQAEKLASLINEGPDVPVTMGGADTFGTPFRVNLERIAGSIVKGSARLTDDGQVEYDVKVFENVPQGRILKALDEALDEAVESFRTRNFVVDEG